jgi:hypothetical protein
MNRNPAPVRRMNAPAVAKTFSLLLVVLAIQILPARGQTGTDDPVPAPGEARLMQLVEANVIGVHAEELLLARKQDKGDPSCWPDSPTNAPLEALAACQSPLLAAAPGTVRAWAAGETSAFEPAKDLQPLLAAALPMSRALPVNVFTRYLEKMVPAHPRSHIRGIANLYQTVLEIERDGGILQQLFAFYIGIELPVYVGQLGLPGSDEDFLAVGRQLEGQSCPSPLDLRVADRQIAGRKTWNWGEKNLHLGDAGILTNELLAEPDVAPLIPKTKALPTERVAIIGHSFTMDLHWPSPSAFVPIVTAMFRANSSVQFRQFQAGGLTSRISIKMLWRGSPRSCFSWWQIGAMKTAMTLTKMGEDSGPRGHES